MFAKHGKTTKESGFWAHYFLSYKWAFVGLFYVWIFVRNTFLIFSHKKRISNCLKQFLNSLLQTFPPNFRNMCTPTKTGISCIFDYNSLGMQSLAIKFGLDINWYLITTQIKTHKLSIIFSRNTAISMTKNVFAKPAQKLCARLQTPEFDYLKINITNTSYILSNIL